MFLYQLKSGKEWQTQNAVTESVADKLRALMADRGRKAGVHYRLQNPLHMGPKKVAAKPRVRKTAAKPAESVTESVEDAE